MSSSQLWYQARSTRQSYEVTTDSVDGSHPNGSEVMLVFWTSQESRQPQLPIVYWCALNPRGQFIYVHHTWRLSEDWAYTLPKGRLERYMGETLGWVRFDPSIPLGLVNGSVILIRHLGVEAFEQLALEENIALLRESVE